MAQDRYQGCLILTSSILQACCERGKSWPDFPVLRKGSQGVKLWPAVTYSRLYLQLAQQRLAAGHKAIAELEGVRTAVVVSHACLLGSVLVVQDWQ